MLTFPDDFAWGAATAAYQIEGAVSEDGRGESIWDRFTHTPGRISDSTTGDVTCDHYHLWREDVRLMKELGLRDYRFSVAWPRIHPTGKGPVNRKGLDFYSRLVDELLAADIEPAVTLYHWDLPQALQDRGGWTNRDTADYFTDYAFTMFDALGDRVRKWITLNEPWVIAMMGHEQGIHAPGLRDFGTALSVSHILNLAHAKAVRLFRSDFNHSGRIGITLNLSPHEPESDEDHDATVVADGYLNRWFLDPPLAGRYPEDMVTFYADSGFKLEIADGDTDLISSQSVDFLGVNYYNRHIVRRSASGTFGYETVIPAEAPTTDMGWEMHPPGLYDLLMRLHRDYDAPEFYITENGAAYPDTRIVDGVVQDVDRRDFIHAHLVQAWRATAEGVKLRGYYVWSLMDNFEWSFGLSRRFGIVAVNYQTLERTPKMSALWYRDAIARGGVEEQ